MAVEIAITVIVKPPSLVASGSQTWSIFPGNEIDIRVRYCAYLKTKTENCIPKKKKILESCWWRLGCMLHLRRAVTSSSNDYGEGECVLVILVTQEEGKADASLFC